MYSQKRRHSVKHWTAWIPIGSDRFHIDELWPGLYYYVWLSVSVRMDGVFSGIGISEWTLNRVYTCGAHGTPFPDEIVSHDSAHPVSDCFCPCYATRAQCEMSSQSQHQYPQTLICVVSRKRSEFVGRLDFHLSFIMINKCAILPFVYRPWGIAHFRDGKKIPLPKAVNHIDLDHTSRKHASIVVNNGRIFFGNTWWDFFPDCRYSITMTIVNGWNGFHPLKRMAKGKQ